MKILRSKDEMAAQLAIWKQDGQRIGIVPTMGNLHAGHVSLLDTLTGQADKIITTIYVNPPQFAQGEDFDIYPRTNEADFAKLRDAGSCDAVFLPEQMYKSGHATTISPSGVALGYEAETRPHFFTGVATIVVKLFQHVPADYAIFGEKDFQQLAVLRQMVGDLDVPILLIGHPTVRESDGLALSSRNHYLSAEQRAIAPLLYQTLGKIAAEILAGADIQQSLDKAKRQLLAGGFTKIDYLDLRDATTLAPSLSAKGDNRLFVAAWLGETRLIDNCVIGSHADTI